MRRANAEIPGSGFPALFLVLGPFLKDMDTLVRLPHLVRVLVLIKFQKLSIRIESRLNLIKLIVTKCANKPLPSVWRLHLGNQVECGQGGRVIPREVEDGAEIFPIGNIVAIELNRGPQFFFRGGKVAFLQEDTAQATVERG